MILTSSCSSLKNSIALGGSVAAVTGASTAAFIYKGKGGKAALQGALIIGGIGAALGYFSHKYLEKRDSKIRSKTLTDLKSHNVSIPFTPNKIKKVSVPKKVNQSPIEKDLKAPEVEEIWVEEQIKGNRRIEGHYEWIITQPAKWEIKGENE